MGISSKSTRKTASPRRKDGTKRSNRLSIEALENRSMLATLLTVDTTSDIVALDGYVSLREAVMAANSNTAVGDAPAGSGADRIQFAANLFNNVAAATINLTSALTISEDLVIDGLEPDRLVLDATGNYRVFEIGAGAAVTLRDMTIQGGSPSSGNGGGILNQGDLTLESTILKGNQAVKGGAIANHGGNLTVALSEIRGGNSASDDGGGIYSNGGVVTIESSTITGNSAADKGGGLFVDGGALEVRNSTFSLNAADYGAGIAGNNETWLHLANTTISTNTADVEGGGIHLSGGAWSPDRRLTNVTITENRSASGGGIQAALGATIPVDFYNTIVAGNKRLVGSTADDIGAGSSFSPQGSNNFIGGTPQLAPLANYGGPTATHVPLAGSPVIDAGSNQAATVRAPRNDQRGFDRIIDGNANGVAVVDIGAGEYFALPTVIFGALDSVSGTPLVLDVSANDQKLHVFNVSGRDSTVTDVVDDASEQQLLDALFRGGNPGVTLAGTGGNPFDLNDNGFTVRSSASGSSSGVGVFTNFLPHHDNTFGLGPYGLVLSTGDASDYGTGNNTSTSLSTDYGTTVDNTDPLYALLREITTDTTEFNDYSAVTLNFNAESGQKYIVFDVVFGSDEYTEYINNIVDAFGIFFNGVQQFPTQVAYAPQSTHPSRAKGLWSGVTPGTVISPAPTINVNHPQMNGGNAAKNGGSEVDAFNPDLVRHSVNGTSDEINELDGVIWPHQPFAGGSTLIASETPVLRYVIPINPTDNEITIVIADTEDGVWDSTAFINIVEDAAPQVASVAVSGSTSTHAPQDFRQLAGSGSQIKTTPVGGANRIDVSFTEPVTLSGSELSVVGDFTGTTYGMTYLGYDPVTFTASWQLTAGVFPADQLIVTLADSVVDSIGQSLDGEWTNPTSISDTGTSEFPSGDGVEGGDFQFYFTTLPGDVNADNVVDGSDFSILSYNWATSGKNFAQGDVSGDGNVNSIDLNLLTINYGRDLTSWIPSVLAVTISGTNSLDGTFGLYTVPDGSGLQLKTVPIGGAKRVAVQFSKYVDLDGTELSLVGDYTSTTYGMTYIGFNASTRTATWELTTGVFPADQIVLTLDDSIASLSGYNLDGEWTNPTSVSDTGTSEFPSGNGVEGGDFQFYFTILPGDANGDNIVNVSDYSILSTNWGTSGKNFTQADFNGDGNVNGSDLSLLSVNYNKDFTSWPASLLAARSSGSSDSRHTTPTAKEVAFAAFESLRDHELRELKFGSKASKFARV